MRAEAMKHLCCCATYAEMKPAHLLMSPRNLRVRALVCRVRRSALVSPRTLRERARSASRPVRNSKRGKAHERGDTV
ncbi:hypothetical protein GLE_2198 [Lysobacter enzymogenes]|uniref:Uncharacterized protein n=1 Tax=Lysobacter enzymogenes TaxID=69 RepID=A0A0S2DG61_LYSEN|nr:hypothetical protein GLE_2198 [Lysobacter enzymogenes]